MIWIDRCLTSLLQSSVPLTIVVIDNKSQDKSLDYIAKTYSQVIILPQSENLGFGKANNIGINYALTHGATHVLLLNQDAWIDSTMISELLKYDDDSSILSPKHLNGKGDALDNNFRSYLNKQLSSDIIEEIYEGRNQMSSYEISFINAACWLLPMNLIKQVGGFNPLFVQYGEDVQFINRLQGTNFRILLIPKVSVFHDRKQFGSSELFSSMYYYNRLLLEYTKPQINYATLFGAHIRTIIRLLFSVFGNPSLANCIWISYKKLWYKRYEIRQSNNIENNYFYSWLDLMVKR